MELPSLPCDFDSVVAHLNSAPSNSKVLEAVQPFKDYESKLRRIFAQQPQHQAVKADHLVSVFKNELLLTKARDVNAESEGDREKYILALPDSHRRKNSSPATVTNIKDFTTNFHLFSEQSLVDLDWSNVVAAGSSVVTPLLPVREPHNRSKRALRAYYHEQLAPASDVDLFIYGLDEEQAIKKVKQIEASIRDSVLAETVTIRTKNAITIVSEYPTRHVQIVLRLYNSITEILTGFDVDCSCVAYDGKSVWASPRALAAFATQQNSIDLTRRSPSYENRLSKYSRRGFEVYWPEIDRSRVDPTIYERAFNRVVGLARLLVLEKLPHPSDRDSYAEKRRWEKSRPQLPWHSRYRHSLPGNVKDSQPDDVPDWLEDADQSDYHTFTIPYGPNYNAKRIEKLLFKQDLLLNAEWNRDKNRKTNLHRHPAFFGSVDDVIHDCCGFCPEPTTDEDLEAYEEESKVYISGELRFIKDDPGRQTIGSFNPLTAEDWTDMAYTGSTLRLCRAIVENDVETVTDWLGEQGANVNDRDHTGRTPLQLACMCSRPEIVQILIEHGARLVSRIYSGMTALHMAAHRGHPEIVKLLLDRSEINREEEDRKKEGRKAARRKAAALTEDVEMSQADEDVDMVDEDEVDDEDEHMTEGSFVKVKDQSCNEHAEEEDEPDVYDVDVLAWDSPVSALHLAIIGGHVKVISMLIDRYGADVMLPAAPGNRPPILNLVLPIHLSSKQADETIRTLLAHGASPAQADTNQVSNLHFLVSQAKIQFLDILDQVCGSTLEEVVNHISSTQWYGTSAVDTPLLTAIRLGSPELTRKVLDLGAHPHIKLEEFVRYYVRTSEDCNKTSDYLREKYLTSIEQPIIEAVQKHVLVDIVSEMIDMGVDVNTLTRQAQNLLLGNHVYGDEPKSLLDYVQQRIKELEDYTEYKEDRPQKPDDLTKLDLPPRSGEYQSWLLRTNHAEAQAVREEQTRQCEEDIKTFDNRDLTDLVKKRATIDDMLLKWQALKTKILQKGSKPFKELHPNANIERDQHHNQQQLFRSTINKQKANKPFENKVSFQVPDLTDSKKKDNIDLFEAIYSGDEEKVKELCLDTENPLQISVFDSVNFSPFSLAVLKKHYNLAKTILDISAAQHEPPKEQKKTYRYRIGRTDDRGDDGDDNEIDEDDDHDEEEDSNVEIEKDLRLYKELVDDKHTIDDIRKLSKSAKSKISPLSLFEAPCELWRMMPLSVAAAKAAFKPPPPNRIFWSPTGDGNASNAWHKEMIDRERPRNRFSLFRYAIVTRDVGMLKFLLKEHHDLVYRKDDSSSLQRLQMNTDDFNLALQLGNTEMIGEIIRATGTLLPLADLVKRSGIELDEKPAYYQGLSVYGQKRGDWAQRDRGQKDKNNADQGSPLLTAVIAGNIKTVEYFLSDTPLRCYEEFAKSFEDDKHIQSLAKTEGGVERALHLWLDTRSNLAIHMAVMADPSISKPVRDFLVRRMPQCINAKSREGVSPLQLAFQLKHYDAAQELIDAGADQMTRNTSNVNLLHTIYTTRDDLNDSALFRRLVKTLRPEAVRSLCLQRCSGDGVDARTPLMMFINCGSLRDVQSMQILDDMLELSGEQDLEVMNGAGDYPLHSLARSKYNIDVIKYIANRRPDLLFKENATGMTPIEIAETALLRAFVDSPPNINPSNQAQVMWMAQAQPLSFLNRSNTEPYGIHYAEREVYDVLREIASKATKHRSLISLLDANETARRLAKQQIKANEELKQREAQGLKSYRGWPRHTSTDERDEVALWMNKATALR